MQAKVSVVLLKSKAVDTSSDMNKMSVHLEQLLTEKDGVDLKVRQTLTEAAIKSASFVVFCGYDSVTLSEFFKAVASIEAAEGNSSPTIFLYEEPGQSIWEHINYIFRSGVDLRRIDPKIFDKVIDTWSYRDIIGTVDVAIRRLGTNSTPTSDPDTK
jgi:hypothetical protein